MWLALSRVEGNAAPGGRAPAGYPDDRSEGTKSSVTTAPVVISGEAGLGTRRPRYRVVDVPGDHKTCTNGSDAAERDSAAPARGGYSERCDVVGAWPALNLSM